MNIVITVRVSYHFDLLVRSDHYWEKKNLKWDLANSSTRMQEATVIASMQAAFAEWAKASPFNFTQAKPNEEVCAQIEQINLSIVRRIKIDKISCKRSFHRPIYGFSLSRRRILTSIAG